MQSVTVISRRDVTTIRYQGLDGVFLQGDKFVKEKFHAIWQCLEKMLLIFLRNCYHIETSQLQVQWRSCTHCVVIQTALKIRTCTTADLVTFTEEILNGKLFLLCNVTWAWQKLSGWRFKAAFIFQKVALRTIE